MPAPPVFKDLPPLEEDEDTFDIDELHAAEDALEAEGTEGPLRIFLGAPSGESVPPVPMEAEAAEGLEDGPIWDVSALAMPEAPDDGHEESHGDDLAFLDDSHDVSEDDVVSLDNTPPPLVMQISLDEDPGLSEGDWSDESPTVPSRLASAVTVPNDTPPPVQVSAQGNPMDVPDRTPFAVGTDEAGLAEHAPTRVDALVSDALGDGESPESEWNEDEATFFGDGPPSARSVPDTPPTLRPQSPDHGAGFRPIPEKLDPPMVPILAALLVLVVVAFVLVLQFGGNDGTSLPGTLENPIKARPPASVARTGLSATGATEQAPVGDVGFLTIESDKDAIIYVGDQKMGTTPLTRIEVAPGNHRVLAMDVETGARKSATAVVVRGQDRRIVFQFR